MRSQLGSTYNLGYLGNKSYLEQQSRFIIDLTDLNIYLLNLP